MRVSPVARFVAESLIVVRPTERESGKLVAKAQDFVVDLALASRATAAGGGQSDDAQAVRDVVSCLGCYARVTKLR